jgi:hypothetical protein
MLLLSSDPLETVRAQRREPLRASVRERTSGRCARRLAHTVIRRAGAEFGGLLIKLLEAKIRGLARLK